MSTTLETKAMRILKHITPWLLPISLQAQLFTNNGTTITTDAGFQVNGSVLNTAAGQFANSGIITLTGDWTNNAGNSGFGAGQGSVVLGGGDQTIGGSSITVFNDLALSGTGTKSLLQHAEVGGAYLTPSGVLALNDRPMDLNGFDLTVRNAAPTAITRTSGFIISERDPLMGYSRVRWNIGASAMGGFHEIPFGEPTTGAFLPFSAGITTAGTGSNGWIAVATYPTDPVLAPNNRPLPTGLATLTDMGGNENAHRVLDRWWVMESGDYTTAPVAEVKFTYRDSEWATGTNTIMEGALQLERYLGGWNMFPTVVETIANTLTTTGIPLLTSTWTASEFGSPLPVELMVFTGERVDRDHVDLDWATATEQDNAGFEVWRMIDGEAEFKQVGWVDGTGHSQQVRHYGFTDRNRTSRVSYYKLRQVDHAGTGKWSPLAPVAGIDDGSDIALYPNPTRDAFFISGLAPNARVSVIDGSGRLVRDMGPGPRFDVQGLRAGMYIVRMEAEGVVRQERLIVQ